MTIEEMAQRASQGYADDGYQAGLYTGFKEGAEWMLRQVLEQTGSSVEAFKRRVLG